jgi:glycosyltransferase involved in cell wall biosynthesis
MKILQVMAGAEHGGAETAFVDMCIALHEAGEHIEVATRANKLRVPRLINAGITVHTLPFGGAVDVFTPWRLQKIIEKFQPDIVQTWMSRAIQKVPRWNLKNPVPRYSVVARLGSPYKVKYFKNADFFVTITPDIKTYLEGNGIAAERIRHINNFAEVDDTPVPIDRSLFNTPKEAPLVLGLGRLHRDKAFDTLIKVAAEMPGLHVWIAGEGPERSALEHLIKTLNLQDRVKLLGWRDDRAALLQSCDVCAFISRNEGFGTVFVQAWAQKTPVVVCDADGPRQFVRHGEDGMIAKIDDIPAIKTCIERVLSDKALASMLVENGYLRYQAEFTKHSSVQGYLQWYHEIRSQAATPDERSGE